MAGANNIPHELIKYGPGEVPDLLTLYLQSTPKKRRTAYGLEEGTY